MTPDHLQHPNRSAQASETKTPNRPGWPEIVVGMLALAAATAVLPLVKGPLGLESNPVVFGLILSAWSGVVGLAGFTTAALIRIRSWGAFSVRRTTWRWMGIGAVAGMAAFLLKGLVNSGVVALLGPVPDPQGSYYEAAAGGPAPMILSFAFLATLVPIGEEFLFRGVITNALLRYGPVIGVLGSSAIFALMHGVNIALPTAFVIGIIAAEVMRRSGSIWPAVAVHAVNNLALPIFVLIGGVIGPS